MLQIFNFKEKLVPAMEKIRDEIKSGSLLTADGNKYAKDSVYNYQNAIRWIRSYEEKKGPIYVKDINLTWGEEFTKYLMNAGLSKNSIAAILKRLKASMRRLHKQNRASFNGSGIRSAGELTTSVYTTLDEIEKLLDVDLNDTPGLQKVRDVYIIQCFLGLRFSDLRKLLKDIEKYIRVDGANHYFEITTQKTGAVVVIPIGRVVKEAVSRNDYKFANMFSFQHYNKSIKEIAHRAGIVEEVIMTRTQGGYRVDTVRLKFGMMSSHTARRSFATNAYLSGVPILNIMQITGHSSQTSFHRYIRCSSMEAAMKIIDHPFFL